MLDFHSLFSIECFYIFSEYGGIQEFMSFTVYENIAKFAIKEGWLDTSLNQRSWESRFFQFYAGDLYEVIPKVATVFLAN